jgi:DNA-binding transcriptional ArsR family regulator
MVTTISIAHVGALVGDPARAAMLQALMDGRALTASELADVAGITPQTASSHLARLTEGGLLSATKQGRHRYHRLANPQIARMLEGLMTVAACTTKKSLRTGPRDAHMRLARTCYDHLAGWVGVSLTNALADRGWIKIDGEAALVTSKGMAGFAGLGLNVEPGASGSKSKPLCRPCLDWSERRSHLAGRVGAALCSHALEKGWMKRRSDSRAVDITPGGWRALREQFEIERPEQPPGLDRK